MRAADGKASVSLRADGIQYLQWLQGTTINGQDARDVLETSFRLADQQPYAILVDMTAISHQTLGAREAFNADSRVIAAALLGDGPMDEVLAGGAVKAVHPTAFFTSEKAAISWLTAYVEASSSAWSSDTDSA